MLASFLNAIANVCMYITLRSQEYIVNLELLCLALKGGSGIMIIITVRACPVPSVMATT